MKSNTWYKVGQLEDLAKFTDLDLFSLNKQCEDKEKYDVSDREFKSGECGKEEFNEERSEGIWIIERPFSGHYIVYVKFNEYYGFLESHHVMPYKTAINEVTSLIS